MLISLQHDKPLINPETYKGAVVVEFARFRNWGEDLDRGMKLIDHEEWLGGAYLFRVSLHAPTIYKIPTICRSELATRNGSYVLTLMQGTDHEGWALEVSPGAGAVVIELDYFDPDISIPMKLGTMTLWEHLENQD